MGIVQEIARWRALAQEILECGQKLFFSYEIPVTDKRSADPMVIAAALLARSMSNMRGALLLIDAKRLVEARVIVRCCLENSYWIAALADGGDEFVREMQHDELVHRHIRGQNFMYTFQNLDVAVEKRMRDLMHQSAKRSKNKKSLNPKSVAQRADFRKSYILYEMFSSDSAHPSIDALSQYIIIDKFTGERGIDFEPIVKESALAETLQYLCLATLRVCGGVDVILGNTVANPELNALVKEYTSISQDSSSEASTENP